jgi:beta-N-acetylhexosaminidase
MNDLFADYSWILLFVAAMLALPYVAGPFLVRRNVTHQLEPDLVPFQALVDLGAEVVMVGHVTYPSLWGDLPASLAPGAYELLRSRGFHGVAITDALGMGAVHARFGFDLAPAMAVAAGADLVLVNQGDEVRTLRDGLLAAVAEGRLTEARVDDAVRRVLELRGEDPTGIVCP